MILVTGGAGYIGSHCVKRLLEDGHEAVTFDNLSEGHRAAVVGGTFVQGDLASANDLRSVFERFPIDGVVHFAANCYVGESVEHPEKYFRNNVANTLNLLAATRRAGVQRFIFSSTAATYGVPREVPVPEDHPTEPINPYGRSKLMVEQMLEWFDRAYGLRFVSLRYFNAAGADPDGRLGEDHDPETHLLPIAILAALERRPPLRVFGTDYGTPDGTCVRDYIHIVDLADAHIRALAYLADGGTSAHFNLGNERGYSIREVIRTIERVGGRPVPAEDAPRREGDPPELVASSQRAREVLGWNPRFGDLDSIVETAWRWHESHPEGYGDREDPRRAPSARGA